MALGALLAELSSDGPGRRPLIELVGRWAVEKPDAPAFTFVDFSLDPQGAEITLSWAETDRRARATAAALRQAAKPGERAALLLPQRHEYMMTMLGAMYARVVAVPLFSPDLPGYAERLIGAYTDSEPAVIVTTRGSLPHVEKFLADQDVTPPRQILFADEIDPALADTWRDEPISIDEVAYLQYTSGSTRRPAGVEITHGNVAANARQLWSGWAPDHPDPELVTWLPLFHDMGLIAAMALPLVKGDHVTYTDPVAFLMNPMRWMRLLSGRTWVYTAGPNFAYDYVASLASPDKIADLDLSGLVTCLNGAEPIRPATLNAFYEAFAPAGLRQSAQGPGYGLAEATVFVTAAADDVPPKIVTVDRDKLAQGELAVADETAERTTALVSCGRPMGQYVAIVDPDTCAEQPDGRVGEIWVHGPNVAPGYWRNSERSQETFGGVLADPGDLPAGPWLRTGDYGVVFEGELYVTGRIKDLIIVDGRNHYPQDIELTVQEAHPAIRPDHVAAFAVEGAETERLVVIAERNRRVPLRQLDLAEVDNAVRSAVNVEHEMSVHEFVLVEPGVVSRTTSGKVARAATRQRYLDGALQTTAARLAAHT
ncbi:fatty acid CoA ligase FadD32 [Thermomonospora echinospora]|uniref:Fatty acid CoA ligase FadD32 n=1 Tax=Thermomonospora echinospora TaxID=1992 RepID=A0A1H6CD40_9ACTN|nr:fatty acyl-AMP ligase [Thermomonospora echinospora]SEG70818.1 fatty acid CoA ligase FadD32 [Thermomonospora echinospora]